MKKRSKQNRVGKNTCLEVNNEIRKVASFRSELEEVKKSLLYASNILGKAKNFVFYFTW